MLAAGHPHPRNYGTFPKILGHYACDETALTLEDAVRRLTSFAAQRLGLKDRGLLRERYLTDIVVLDPAAREDPLQAGLESLFHAIVTAGIDYRRSLSEVRDSVSQVGGT